jgi:hypothetical protein
MNKYGTVFQAGTFTASADGSVIVFDNDNRWDADEVDLTVGVLQGAGAYVRVGYGANANNPMVYQADAVTQMPIRLKNVGASNKNQEPLTIAYKGTSIDVAYNIGAHIVKQEQKKWIETTSNGGFSARTGASALSFGGAIYLLGGYDGNASSDVWQSLDNGVTWSQISQTPFLARQHAMVWATASKMYIMGGDDGSNTLNDIWSSGDGITWTLETGGAAWSARAGACLVYLNGSYYLYGGTSDGSATLNDVWSSTDLVTWTLVTNAATWTSRAYAGCYSLNGRMWLIGGIHSVGVANTNKNETWFSADGETWTLASTTGNTIYSKRSMFGAFPVNKNFQAYIFGGDGVTGSIETAYISMDSESWSLENSSVSFGPREEFASCIHNGSLWMIGGTDGNTSFADVWRTNVPVV